MKLNKNKRIVVVWTNAMTNRIASKAVTRTLITSYDDQEPLSKREMEQVLHALRFCHVPNVLARLDADSARHALKRLDEMT